MKAEVDKTGYIGHCYVELEQCIDSRNLVMRGGCTPCAAEAEECRMVFQFSGRSLERCIGCRNLVK